MPHPVAYGRVALVEAVPTNVWMGMEGAERVDENVFIIPHR